MSINRKMENENMVHIHNGNLLALKKNEIMKSAGKWVDLENNVLRSPRPRMVNITSSLSLMWILARNV